MKAEKLIRNLAQRLERDAPGVSKSILEELDEVLTVSRLGLPAELRRSLACTNIIENMMGTLSCFRKRLSVGYVPRSSSETTYYQTCQDLSKFRGRNERRESK